MIAEHLNLVAGVTDRFTEDLTRLASHLQRIDYLESKLSPFTIRVNVRDRQLRQLEQRMQRVQAQSTIFASSPSSSSSASADGDGAPTANVASMNVGNALFTNSTFLDDIAGPLGGVADAVDSDSDNQQLLNAVRNLDLTSDDVGPMAISQMTVGAATINAATINDVDGFPTSAQPSSGGSGAAAGASSGAAASTVTDGGGLRLNPSELSQMEGVFGRKAVDRMMINDDFTMLDAMGDNIGKGFFQTTRSDIQSNMPISGEQWRRAFDFQSFSDEISDNLFQNVSVRGGRTRDLGLPSNLFDSQGFIKGDRELQAALTQLSPKQLDMMNISRVDHIDMGKLSRLRFMDELMDMRIGMTQLYDFLAALMPLIFVFVGALPAAIGAVGALAVAAVGAAGALAAIGALGWVGAAMNEAGGDNPGMEDFIDALDDLSDEFFEAFGPLAQRLEPTFQSGLDGLSRWFDELADRGDVLLNLRDDARAFGRWFIPFSVNSIAAMGMLANHTREVWSIIGEGIESRDIILGFANALKLALPYLLSMVSVMFDALPGLVRFSTGMMQWATLIITVTSLIVRLVSSFLEFAYFINDGNRALGVLIGSFFTLVSAMLVTLKVYGMYLTTVKVLSAAKAALATSIMGTVVAKKAATAAAYLQAAAEMKLGMSAIFAAKAVTGLKIAIMGLMAVTGIGLIVAGIGYMFDKTATQIDDATSSLEDFEDQYDQMGGSGFDGGMNVGSGGQATVRGNTAGDVYNYTDNSSTTINAPSRRAGESMSKADDYSDKDRDDFMHFS